MSEQTPEAPDVPEPVSDADLKMARETERSRPGVALAAAIILGVAAILTAWASYHGSLSGGDVTKGYADQQALISQANDTYAQSDRETQLDQQFFLSYAINAAQGNDNAVAYLDTTMSPELAKVIQWWVDQPQDTGPTTPFVEENPEFANLPSQQLLAAGIDLMNQSDAARASAEEANSTGDRFALANVFFAIVLFLAGVATLFGRWPLQVGILGLSIIVLIVGAVILVTTPGWAAVS